MSVGEERDCGCHRRSALWETTAAGNSSMDQPLQERRAYEDLPSDNEHSDGKRCLRVGLGPDSDFKLVSVGAKYFEINPAHYTTKMHSAFRGPSRLIQQTTRSLPRPTLPHTPHPPPSTRTLLTSRPRGATLAANPPAHPTILIFSPTPEAIKQQELDIELLPPQDINIDITDRAAQVRIPTNITSRFFFTPFHTPTATARHILP